jgi:hypothetical protein
MADSGIFRINPLQPWQREAILKAAQLLRERFGDPPNDAPARSAHDGLIEVIDPTRRTVRLQRELSEATRTAALTHRTERRARDRRGPDRRTANVGLPQGVAERRKSERRKGERRRRSTPRR